MASKPSTRRLKREFRDLEKDPSSDFAAYPLKDNLFEWHFTLKGAVDTEFEGGLYHGKIVFPSEYPFKPPNIIMLTPSGRFEVGKKICLSMTGFHPEQWQPSWNIRTICKALISMFEEKAKGAIAGIDVPKDQRRHLARKSRSWSCPTCKQKVIDHIPNSKSKASDVDSTQAKTPNTEAEPPTSEAPAPVPRVEHRDVPPPAPTQNTSLDYLVFCLVGIVISICAKKLVVAVMESM